MSPAPRRRFRPRIRTLLALILLAVVAWSVYSYWSDYAERSARRARETMSPTVGADCLVFFRSDVTSPDRAFAQGRFVRMNHDWLVLEHSDGEQTVRQWIPREQVLVVEEQVGQ